MDGSGAARARIGMRRAWAVEAGATLRLAGPLALTNLSQFALTLTDAVILGWYGTAALGASSIGASLYWAMLAPGFGLALAAAPLLAQARGVGLGAAPPPEWEAALPRAIGAAAWASAAFVLPAWAVLWWAEALLLALGQTPELAALAGEYVRALMWGLLPFCVFVVLRGWLAALNRPGPALAATILGIGVNAALCWVLVFGAFGLPGLGILGAGIASSLANLIMLASLVVLIRADRALRGARPFAALGWPGRARLLEVARLGLPISGSMLLEIGVFSAATLVMGWFGTVAVAAHAITLQAASMTFMVPMGIGQAATARVGVCVGAGDAAGAARAGWVAIGLAAAVMAGMALLLGLAGRPIAWAFLDPADTQAAPTVALASTLLLVAALFQLADGVQVAGAGALRGRRDTAWPMLIAGLGYWGLGLPLGIALALPGGLGPAGVWLGLAAGLGAVAALMVARWRVLARR